MSDHKVYQEDLSISEKGIIRLNQIATEDGTVWSVVGSHHDQFVGSGRFAASELIMFRLDPKTEEYLPRILKWMGVDAALIPGMVAIHQNWLRFSEDERRGLGTVSEFRSVEELLAATEGKGQ